MNNDGLNGKSESGEFQTSVRIFLTLNNYEERKLFTPDPKSALNTVKQRKARLDSQDALKLLEGKPLLKEKFDQAIAMSKELDAHGIKVLVGKGNPEGIKFVIETLKMN